MTGSTELYDWRRGIVSGKDDRRPVTIHQLDAAGGEIVNSWRLEVLGRAVGRAVVQRNGNDIAIEELELAYEDLVGRRIGRAPSKPRSLKRPKEPEMAVQRDRPYAQFNFLVDLGTGNTDGPQAGFEECSEIGMSVDVTEYRNGNDKENSVRKLTGLARYPDVTLKRGIIGSLDLYQWLNQIRNGDEGAYRTVTVQLLNEDHTSVVQTWKLLRARPVKHVSGPFNARCSDVAIEELTLAYERLELE